MTPENSASSETAHDEDEGKDQPAMDTETSPTRVPEKAQYRHWRSLSDGFTVSLVIVGPAFLFEELWRGRPLIDQPGKLWIVPGIVMAIGFFTGGGIAGRHRRNAGGAFNQGLLVAGLTLALIFMADIIRRVILHAPLDLKIIGVWCACAAGGLLVSGLGALSARRRHRQRRYRAQVDRIV